VGALEGGLGRCALVGAEGAMGPFSRSRVRHGGAAAAPGERPGDRC